MLRSILFSSSPCVSGCFVQLPLLCEDPRDGERLSLALQHLQHGSEEYERHERPPLLWAHQANWEKPTARREDVVYKTFSHRHSWGDSVAATVQQQSSWLRFYFLCYLYLNNTRIQIFLTGHEEALCKQASLKPSSSQSVVKANWLKLTACFKEVAINYMDNWCLWISLWQHQTQGCHGLPFSVFPQNNWF